MHQGNRIALSPGARSCAAAPVMGPRRKPVDILEKYWGYSKFRFCQEQVINTILSGTDCLVVMPTGGGKSICYQVRLLCWGRGSRHPCACMRYAIEAHGQLLLLLFRLRFVRRCRANGTIVLPFLSPTALPMSILSSLLFLFPSLSQPN